MKNLDWNLARAFHATATEGSLSAAARKLHLTQPTLSRQITALEKDIGAMLFERTGRKLALTETGLHLLEHVEKMDEAAHAVMRAANGKAQDLSGHVSISVTDVYGSYIMPQILARLRREAPDLVLNLIVTNKLSDLFQREADIAIRHHLPTQSGLVGVHAGDTQAYFYASKAFIAAHPEQANAKTMQARHFIGVDHAKLTCKYVEAIGLPMAEHDLRLFSNNFTTMWEMAKQGMGIILMVREVGERTKGMVRLYPDLASMTVPVWVVAHREVATSPRLQWVQRVLVEELTAVLEVPGSKAAE